MNTFQKLTLLLLIILVSACVSKQYLQEKEQLEELHPEQIEHQILQATEAFARQMISNCQSGQFPLVNRENASAELVGHWNGLKVSMRNDCEYFSRPGDSISSFELDKIIRDSQGNTHFRYQAAFTSEKAAQVLVTRDAEELLHYITAEEWGKSVRLNWMVPGLVIE